MPMPNDEFENLIDRFTCPREGCGCAIVEEVVTGITMAQEVEAVCDPPDDQLDDPVYGELDQFHYGEADFSPGEISHYRCGGCGEYITWSQEELIEVLKGMSVK